MKYILMLWYEFGYIVHIVRKYIFEKVIRMRMILYN